MKTNFKSVCIVLLISSLMPTLIYAEYPDTSGDWGESGTNGWREIVLGVSRTINLTGDVKLHGQITIPKGYKLTINGAKSDGGKYKISNYGPTTSDNGYLKKGNSYCMFYVKGGGELVLNNVDIDGMANNDWIDGINSGHKNVDTSVAAGSRRFRFGYDTSNSEPYRPLIFGGIYNCGTLTLNGCDIHDINSKMFTNKEGFLYYRQYGAITVTNRELNQQNDSYSGTINNDNLSTTITNSNIYENISYGGSALLTRQCGTGTNIINISNTNVYNNVVRCIQDYVGANESQKWGGVIRTEGSSKAELTLTGVKIHHNFANAECSGLFYNAVSLVLNGCEINNNETFESAGGLRIETNCYFIGSPTKVHDNTAGTLGGGVYFYGYSSNAYESNTEDWVYNLNDNLEVYNNTAGTYGGGIAFDFTSGTNIGSGNIIANVNGGNIYGNSATSAGGGIYAVNKSTKYPNITIYLNDGNIGKSGGANTATYGGGIYIDGMAISSTNAAGSTNTIEVAYNEATQNGGGIYSNGGNVTLQGNLKVHDNKAAGGTIPCGGGIYCDGGTLTVNNADVATNTAQDGAGIYATNSATLNIETGNISYNTASGWGAGIRAENNSTITLANGNINNNTCANRAGGIYLANSTMNITGSAEIFSNTATSEMGGGVYALNSDFTMNNGKIYQNRANTSGGGIYFELTDAVQKTLTFGGGEIKENHATTGSGGGVYISGFFDESGNVTAAKFNMKAGTVSDNDALRVPTESEVPEYNTRVKLGAGGGIYIQEGYATLGVAGSSETCTISGNKCGQYGGGIYMTSSHGTSSSFASTLTMNNGVVDGNTAGLRGGGIYMKQSELTMKGGDVTHNTATTDHAGGIDLNNTVFTMDNGKISGNKAGKRGGGIYYNNTIISGDVYKDRDFIFNGGEISHNIAGEYGGGVCIYTGGNDDGGEMSQYQLIGGKIEYNTADNGGGVYYNGWSITSLQIEDTNIEYNTAYVGGGLLAYNGNVSYNNGLIRYNKAILRPGQKASDFDGKTMNHEGHCDRSNDDAILTSLSGMGGGIFGNSVAITVGGTQFGIYRNTADVCADDILMNAGVENGTDVYLNSTINLPNVSSMTIRDFDVPQKELFWAQDYIKKDSGYGNRPVNWCDPSSYETDDYIDRYRTKLYNFDPNIGKILPGRDNDYANDYLCLALGYKMVRATITKSGLKENDSAIFNVYRGNVSDPSAAEPYMQVLLTGTAESSVARTLLLEPGDWTVVEADWSWAYTPGETKQTKTLTTVAPDGVSDLDAYNTFSFSNTPESNTPPHAEALKENIITISE